MRHNAQIVGAYEHPLRYAPDRSVAQLHAECARGALEDAGLQLSDVDGFFCSGDAYAGSLAQIADHLNLRLRCIDGTEIGGASSLSHIGHAARAIERGDCRVALITSAGRPRSAGQATGTERRDPGPAYPSSQWETPYHWTMASMYGMYARRHMHEFGTTSAQMAWVKVAASHHAQHNRNAVLQKIYTVDDVLSSPVVADPLHRLDCCVISDGGGALVVAHPDIARELKRPAVRIAGYSETIKTNDGGFGDMVSTGAVVTGPNVFRMAGITTKNIQYASIYDNFTIMVIMQLEDLGFCKKGEGGRFVEDGNLISGRGAFPINTDGGGLCNNHPSNRGGVTKAIEAVRQLRGESHPAVQVKNCGVALATGPGGIHGMGHSYASVVLTRD